MPKVYCWANSGAGTDWQAWIAMAEDGQVIKQHICSHESWARTDLHDRFPELWKEKFGGFGDGQFYVLVWEVAPADVYERNQALRLTHEAQEATA